MTPLRGKPGLKFSYCRQIYLDFNKSCCVRDFEPRIQFAQKCIPLCFILIYECLDIQRIYQFHGIFFPEIIYCIQRIVTFSFAVLSQNAQPNGIRPSFQLQIQIFNLLHTPCILLIYFLFQSSFKTAILISTLPSSLFRRETAPATVKSPTWV